MSAYLTIYVGPFLHCKRRPGPRPDVNNLTSGRLYDLRGSLGAVDGDFSHFGPNIEIPKIGRQLRFDGHREKPVVMGINKMSETAAFIQQFEKDIQVLRDEYESVEVEWGVVPGVA